MEIREPVTVTVSIFGELVSAICAWTDVVERDTAAAIATVEAPNKNLRWRICILTSLILKVLSGVTLGSEMSKYFLVLKQSCTSVELNTDSSRSGPSRAHVPS